MILAIVGEKGGTGKSTAAINLAQIRATQGHDVLLLDTDPQGSSSSWSTIRDDSEHLPKVPCLQKTGKGVLKEVQNLKPRYEDIIIDAGGRDSAEMRAALCIADKAYIPVQPTQFDVETLFKVQELVEQAKIMNPSLEAFVFINRASTNIRVGKTSQAKEVIESDDLSDLCLSKVIIHERIAFQNAVELGQGVCELGSSKATEEIIKLYKETFECK